MRAFEILHNLNNMTGNKMSQAAIAEALGTDQPQVSRWMRKSKPQQPGEDMYRKIVDLGRRKGVIGADRATAVESQGGIEPNIPEIDVRAGAGGGGLTVLENSSVDGIRFSRESIRTHWHLPNWVLTSFHVEAQHLAAFPVQGDSMEPTLSDGDVIFVDTRHRHPSPPAVYVLADEFGGVIVKRLEVVSRKSDEHVKVKVQSDNPLHETRVEPLEEIAIIGRYVGRFTR